MLFFWHLSVKLSWIPGIGAIRIIYFDITLFPIIVFDILTEIIYVHIYVGIDYPYLHITLLLVHELLLILFATWFAYPYYHVDTCKYLYIYFSFPALFLTWLRISRMSPNAHLKVDLVTLAEPQAQMSDWISSSLCTNLAAIFLLQKLQWHVTHQGRM